MIATSSFAQDDIAPLRSSSPVVEFELRITWGGSSPELLEFVAELDQGSMEVVRNLAAEPESIGAASESSGQRLRVAIPRPIVFAGLDARLRAPLDGQLTLKLVNRSKRVTSEHTICVEDALRATDSWVREVDQSDHRLAVQRLASDRLRVFAEPADEILIAGSRWQLTVGGTYTGLPAGSYQLRATVRDADGRTVSEQIQPAQLDHTGSFPLRSIHIDAPETEGPYRLVLALVGERSLTALLSRPLELTRVIDFVVVDPQAPQPRIAGWQTLTTIDAADYAQQSPWSRWLPGGLSSTASTWRGLRATRLAWTAARPVRVGTARARRLNLRQSGSTDRDEVLQLAAGSWIAIPLTGLTPQTPHRVRVTVPIDQPMQLGVAFRSQNGPLVGSLGNDFQLRIAPHECRAGEVADYDLLFWPTDAPAMLALCNLDMAGDASIARVAVDAAVIAPHRPNDDSDGSQPGAEGSSPPRRRIALYLDKPLLSEYFAAPKESDPATGRHMATWKTWYTATQRLMQFMHWYGYNTLVIDALSDGGGIMPSQHLQPTPRWDDGVFFSDGRSPGVKDVLRLILQLAEREGIDVVVGLELNTRLPRLEGRAGRDTSLWQQPLDDTSPGSSRRFYNPLNRDVQNEVVALMRDLTQRYGQFASFAGVQLKLGHDSHLLFQGDRLGFNPRLVDEYQQAVGARLPPEARIAEVMQGPIRLAFLQWRAEQLTDFLVRVGDLIRSGNQSRRLFLNTGPLWDSPADPQALSNPEMMLRAPREFLITMGISPEKIDRAEAVVLLTAHLHGAEPLRRVQEWMREGAKEHATSWADPFMQQTVFWHRAHSLSSDTESAWVDRLNLATLYPFDVGGAGGISGILSRQLHTRDAWWLAVGGWAPLNLNDAGVRDVIASLSHVPAIPLMDVSPRGGKGAVTIRTGATPEAAWILIINASGWEETVHIRHVSARPEVRARLITAPSTPRDAAEPPLAPLPDDWSLAVGPYTCQVYRIDDPEWRVVQTTAECPPATTAIVREQLDTLEDRINRASDPTQQQPLPGLRGGFEQWTAAGDPAGWTRSSLPGVQIAADDRFPHGGRRCVRMVAGREVAGSAWLQSVAVPPPESGRATFRVWLRSAEPEPAVRLVVSGRTRQGQRIERHLEVGRGTSHPIPTDWGTRPFTLVADNLPSEQLDAIAFSIEMIGSGELWIDDATAVQSWITPDERIYLHGELLVAREQLNAGNPFPSFALVDGFWGQYLERFAQQEPGGTHEDPENSSDRPTATSPSGGSASTAAPSSRSTSFLQQIRESLRRRWRK
ncbi:MAG: hypothetical protein D6753_05800 [Planctomycetota bacterium]|nr:MAG: hypothetical protein D6753_05800 [Planctomycetota bacterium]